MKPRRRFIFASLLLMLSAPNSAEELHVICSNDQDWCELMAANFSQKSDIDVIMSSMSSGEALTQLRAQADEPEFDVWWGGTADPHLIAAAEHLTQTSDIDIQTLHDWAKNLAHISGGKTLGIHAGALGIAYNPELLSNKGLEPPLCWESLANPIYKGEIQMADPNTSGTAYTEIATLVQIFGEDKAFELMVAMGENVQKYTTSGSAPSKAAARGDTTLSIGFMHDMVKLRKAGLPLTLVSPCEGTGYEIGGLSIIEGATNYAAAQLWVEYTLSAEAQSQGLQVGVYNVPSNTSAAMDPDSPDLASINLIDYDFVKFGSSDVRRHLLERWNKEVQK